jgi:2-keto-4-pentenoate hydratase
MAEPSTISAFVEEMGELLRGQGLRDGAADITTLTLPQAYEVQEGLLARRVKGGARIVGWKVGCTSAAIRQQFGLTQPISGRLLVPDIFHDGAQLPGSSFVDCAVEPELVFRLGADLKGEVDDDQIISALAEVCAGIELHNYRFWYGTPTQQELIASNGIHAGLVLSPMRPLPKSWDLEFEDVWLLVNGEVRATGRCAEIMGSPLRSIQWLARHAAERGQGLRAGELVIPGSAVELVKVKAGDSIEARFASVGSCHARLT